MDMNMKKLTVLVILAFQCCIGYAQNEICFIYDAAGNRIERKLCCTNCIAQPGSDERSAMPDPSIFDDLVLYPNPSSGIFILRGDALPPETQITIFNMDGKLIIKQLIGSGEFDISSQPPNTYVLIVEHNGIKRRFVLEKINK